MVGWIAITLLGSGLLSADQPLVTQTALPPPGTSAAPASEQLAPAPPQAPKSVKVAGDASTPEATKDAESAAPDTTDSKPKTETPPPAQVPKAGDSKRVAAFWIILPGK